MEETYRLLAVLAHPDDESLGMGGLLARYAAGGVETYLVTATSGEQGWTGDPRAHPGARRLAEIREAELRAAADVLGIRGLTLLRYPDGGLASAPAEEATARIARAIRQIRPHVVATFGPDGATGHPDHIAVSQLTAAAILRAADPSYRDGEGGEPHRTAKLYYLAPTRALLDRYEQVFGDSAMTVDGVRRQVPGWPEWAVTARVEAAAHAQQVWRAIRCHRSQLPMLDALGDVAPETHAALWGATTLYRVFSLVSAGQREINLFDGLAPEAAGSADG